MEWEILKIAAIALTGVTAIGVVRGIKPEFTPYLVLATVLLICFLLIEKLRLAFGFLNGVYAQITYGRTFFPILFKVLAVAYLTDFTAQLCADAGEKAIASKLELAGKIIIFYLSIPILASLFELIESVL